MAIKRLEMDGDPEMIAHQFAALKKEVAFLSTFCNSDRLVRIYGASLQNPSTACIIMELAEGGNLHQRIYSMQKPPLTLVESLQVESQHLTATSYNVVSFFQ